MNQVRTCPTCSEVLPELTGMRGRPRKYCSLDCRPKPKAKANGIESVKQTAGATI